MTKHFVYSARTTEKGLVLLNKTKGQMSWDQFISEAVAAHYKLDLGAIRLPPSKFLEEQKAKREAKEAEKAQRKADREAKAVAKKAEKATAKKTGATKAIDKKGATNKGATPAKPAGKKRAAMKAAKPATVTPAETPATEETKS